MIIEFIGSTGAGKTTLVSEVQCRMAKLATVTTASDLILNILHLPYITNPTARNLISDVVGFPFFIRAVCQHQAFMLFSINMLARHAKYTFFTLNYLRSIARKMGTHDIIRRYAKDRTILVDEGTILVAHHLFVYTSTIYSSEDIARFASLVPLPDLVVYVKAPVTSLVQRSLQRGDPPREMRSKNPELVEMYVARASDVFDGLVETDAIRQRTLKVEYPASTSDARGPLVEQITKFILSHEAAAEGRPIASLRPVESEPQKR
jgi:deoxyadenosine/deoxycytidine kinase